MSNLNDIFFTPAANQELTYDQVLEDVQRYFAENHASTIAEAGEGNAERATSLLKELMEHYIVKRKYALDGLSTKELCSKLYEDMAGYSFLKKWIYKPGVEEVELRFRKVRLSRRVTKSPTVLLIRPNRIESFPNKTVHHFCSSIPAVKPREVILPLVWTRRVFATRVGKCGKR